MSSKHEGKPVHGACPECGKRFDASSLNKCPYCGYGYWTGKHRRK